MRDLTRADFNAADRHEVLPIVDEDVGAQVVVVSSALSFDTVSMRRPFLVIVGRVGIDGGWKSPVRQYWSANGLEFCGLVARCDCTKSKIWSHRLEFRNLL